MNVSAVQRKSDTIQEKIGRDCTFWLQNGFVISLRNVVALFLISALALCLSQCSRSPASEAFSPFVPRPCSFSQGSDILCGTVAVPLQRRHRSDTQLHIDIAVFKAKANESAHPLVLLCGGPGSRCVGPQWATNLLRDKYDLVVIDLRGVAKSAAEPFCPQLTDQIKDTIIADLSPSQELSRRSADYDACIKSLDARAVDLSAYGSRDAAADVIDVVKGLGYREWSLWGISYGTRVAQEILRAQPKGLQAVVLDGPVPIDQVHHQTSWFVDSLNHLFQSCTAQKNCNDAYPTLEADFYGVLADYSAHPLQVPLADKGSKRLTATVNGQDLIAFMRRALYNTNNYPMLPLYIKTIRARRKGVIGPVFQQALNELNNRSLGLRLIMNSFDNSLFQTKEAMQRDLEMHPRLPSADLLTSADLSFFEQWRREGRPTIGPIGFQPVKSSIPTLLITGDWDPITPPSNIKHLAPNFSAQQTVVVPYAGHGMIGHACGVQVGQAFLATPKKPVDAPCIALATPPRFHVLP